MPFNWFDVAILVILLVGLQRGRKRGMSLELMTSLRWVVLVVVCGMFYLPIGKMIEQQSKVFSLLFSYLMAYLGLALGVAVVFSFMKRLIGGKLIGSDMFGKGEYYLAMPAGMLRFGCMLLFALALLNARFYSADEIRRNDLYQKDVYGSDFFPTLHTIQRQVFEESLAGPYVRQYLGFFLIEPTQPESKKITRPELKLP